MDKLTKQDILEYFSSKKDELYKKYGLVKVGLFGSFARDEQSSNSDIDLAIELEKDKKSLHTFLGLKRELESAFKRKVDLGIEKTIKPIAKKFIEKEIIYV